MEKKEEKVRFGDLRAILRYVPLFRGRRFVIATDGSLLSERRMANLLIDLAVLQSLNIQVILVHGASHQIRKLAEERGVVLTNSDGIGLTDQATLDVSATAIARLTNQLLAQATVAKIRAACANVLVAHQAGPVKGIDQGFTGVIDRVDTQALSCFLDEGLLPIVHPLGFDRKGQILRLNSDSVATEVAIAMKATKIIFVTSAFLTDAEGNRVRQLSMEEAKEIGHANGLGSFNAPPLPSKLKHAARACSEGVSRVHLVDGFKRDALLAELFSNEGTGTMIYADAYQEIRPANLSDVPSIVAMIRPSVNDEDLMPRSEEDVARSVGDFYVIEIDGNIVGCVALHSYPQSQTIELACLYIKKNHENQGHGRKLVEYAIRKATSVGARKLIALTTGASLFFERLGHFSAGNADDLPPERRHKLDSSGRNSRIMVRHLRPEPIPVASTP